MTDLSFLADPPIEKRDSCVEPTESGEILVPCFWDEPSFLRLHRCIEQSAAKAGRDHPVAIPMQYQDRSFHFADARQRVKTVPYERGGRREREMVLGDLGYARSGRFED
jgi:hypothetical protein